MRWLLALVLALLAANLAWWAWRGQAGPLWSERPTAAVTAPETPVSAPASGTVQPVPATAAVPEGGETPGMTAAAQTQTAAPTASVPPPPGGPAGTGAPAPTGLLVPVQGIAPAQLSDTFGDARGDERMHEALDIMAPAGTPVLAVADGRIEKLFDSDRGGLTIYQFEPSGAWCYYYAHLQSYAPGLAEGLAVRRGEVIGYVGSTGNADPTAPHLHFAIFALTPERQWWTGTPVNPYPLLMGAGSR